MRVVLDGRRTQWHPDTGIPRYVVGLATSLLAAPPEDLQLVVALDARFPVPNWLPAGTETISVHCPSHPARRMLWDERNLGALARGHGADLLHLPWWECPPPREVPTIVSLHDLHLLWHVPATGTLTFVQRWQRRNAVACLRRADGFCFVSSSGAAEAHVLGMSPERPYVVAPLGASWSTVALSSGRPPLGVNGPYVFFLGSGEQRKGPTFALRVFQEMRALGYGGEMLYTGAPPLPPAGGVRGLGRVTDAERRQLMVQADALLITSEWEGFCFPMFEAAAVNRYVVAPLLPALIEQDPPHVLFQVGRDPKVWARECLAVARRAIPEPDFRAFLRKYEWSRTADATMALYRAVLQNGR